MNSGGLIACSNLISLLLCASHLAAQETPPRAATIHERLSDSFRAGDTEAIRSYVRELDQRFPDYVPARLASTTFVYRDGSRVEDFLPRLQELFQDVKRFPKEFSPVFVDFLHSTLEKYSSLADWYKKRGISLEKRQETLGLSTLSAEARAGGWGFDSLFEAVPELTLNRENGTVDFHVRDDGGTRLVSIDELHRSATNPTLELDERVIAVLELGRRKRSTSLELLSALLHDDEWRISVAAATALSEYGRRVIPMMRAFWRNAGSPPAAVEKYLIWVIVRVDEPDPETLAVIRDLREQSEHREYADIALDYLTRPR